VLRHQLKSKIHRARITDSNIDYEGSISIPTDLMEEVDLWVGEKVLVTSITNGARLETYVIPSKAKSRHIVVNGAAAHLISTGHVVTIMAFALEAELIEPKRVLLNELNEIVTHKVL
jgi:aspartate 1-decarboxylase